MEPVVEPAQYPDWMVGPDVVPWDEAQRCLVDARHYWVSSVRADGRPHARPVWGAWHDGRLLLSAGGGFWLMRNVTSAPAVTVHPGEAEGTVVVVEGTVQPAADIEWRDAAVAAYNAKYRWVYRGDSPGTVEVLVERVYAWRAEGPKTDSATRYRFER